jgi:hypothetical protein
VSAAESSGGTSATAQLDGDPPAADSAASGAAAVTALGGLLVGYDTGVVSGALLFLETKQRSLQRSLQEIERDLRPGRPHERGGSADAHGRAVGPVRRPSEQPTVIRPSH